MRKQKNLSQQELANKIGASRTIIGNYERNANTPSIEVLLKLAKVFDVSVDFLIGEGEFSSYDKAVLKRMEDIERLDPDTQKHLFFLIDNVIQNFKTKKAFAWLNRSNMKILLEVKDNKEAFMMELLNNFKFVKAKPLATQEAEVLKGLREALMEVNQIKAGKKKAQPLKEFLNKP